MSWLTLVIGDSTTTFVAAHSLIFFVIQMLTVDASVRIRRYIGVCNRNRKNYKQFGGKKKLQTNIAAKKIIE